MAAAARDIPKVVLDTSVLVRGILSSRGPSGYILDQFLAGSFDLVVSLSIVAEVEGVLHRRHIRSRPSFDAGTPPLAMASRSASRSSSFAER